MRGVSETCPEFSAPILQERERVLGFPCGDSRKASGTAFFCGRLAESFPFSLTKQKKGGGADGLPLYRRGRSRADGIGKAPNSLILQKGREQWRCQDAARRLVQKPCDRMAMPVQD